MHRLVVLLILLVCTAQGAGRPFTSFAYVFLSPGFSPEHNTVETQSGEHRFKAVGLDMGDKHLVLQVTSELVREGYQMIELCGGFGPEWEFKVARHLNMSTPVGAVYYGPAFRRQLVDLLEPKAVQ